MRTVPEDVLAIVQRAYPGIDIRWVERDPRTGTFVGAWEITYSKGGNHRAHVAFWRQELDADEIKYFLWRSDYTRYRSLKEFMNSLGFKFNVQDDFVEKEEAAQNARFSEFCAKLTDSLASLKKRHPDQFVAPPTSKEEIIAFENKLECAEGLEKARRLRKGKIITNKFGNLEAVL